MDDIRIHKYYRSSGYSVNTLLYRFLIADNDLRTYFHLNPYYGILTSLLCLFAVIVITCSIASLSAVAGNEKIFYDLQKDTRKILPRKESILDIRPAYTCIRKHLRQTEIFQEKCDKMLRKEQLEIELMKSRVSCINKLLKPEGSVRPGRGSCVVSDARRSIVNETNDDGIHSLSLPPSPSTHVDVIPSPDYSENQLQLHVRQE